MFNRVKSVIFTFFRSIFSKTMTSFMDPTVIPPYPVHIVSYCQTLAAMKKSEGIEALK
jgi:hypothetical protein